MKIFSIFSIFCFLLILGSLETDAQKKKKVKKNITLEIRGAYGYRCTNECATRGASYHWCEAEHPTDQEYKDRIKYWDYCSPKDDVDYQGNLCRQDHACGTHGYNYKWCYLDEGSWGYCSYTIRKVEIVTEYQ